MPCLHAPDESQLEPTFGVVGERELVLHPVVLALGHTSSERGEHRRAFDAWVALGHRATEEMLPGLAPLGDHRVVDVEIREVETDDLAPFEKAVQDVARDLWRFVVLTASRPRHSLIHPSAAPEESAYHRFRAREVFQEDGMIR